MDIFEPNDSLASAVTLASGLYHVFGVNADWYHFQSEPGQASLQLTPDAGSDVRLVLYNDQMQVIGSNYQSGSPDLNPVVANSTSLNDYYVHIFDAVHPDSGAPHYALQLTTPTEPSGAPLTDFGNNDTSASARPLTTGQYHVHGTNSDWYSISSEGGRLSLQLTPDQGYDVRLVLYNSQLQVIGSNYQSGSRDDNPVAIDSIGHNGFYVKVFDGTHPSDGAPHYTLNATVPTARIGITLTDFGDNDSQASAKAVADGSYNVQGVNADWYAIHVNPGQVSARVTPDPYYDVRAVLYDEQMHVVGSNYQTGQVTADAIVAQANVTGNFYLQVFDGAHATNGTVHYQLDVSTPHRSWATALDLGPVRDSSVTLYDIDGDGRDEIFVGTSKGLDAAGNEIRPAGLACLDADGTVKWVAEFPAMATPDPTTGKTYATTSVSTSPTFADLDGDGNIDIVVGVGGDTSGQFGVVGQPGDRGGVYALTGTGGIMWFHESRDIIGAADYQVDGRPDGVHGAPTVFDIDGDGHPDVIYSGWDQRTWILDGRTGAAKVEVPLLDTSWSSPKIADLNGDGRFEILVTADITENSDARTQTGGVFHVISADGSQTTPGFDAFIGNPSYATLKGKFEEQTLWSSPVTADLDGDGRLEIAYGTGNFFHDGRGQYVKVWHADGTLALQLATTGRTYATPLLADLDGDGRPEIVATTLDGYVHAWHGDGTPMFATRTQPFGGGANEPIFSSPIAVDLDGDGRKEILYEQGTQLIVVGSDGHQRSDITVPANLFHGGIASPAVKDVDGDGRLDIIAGGTNDRQDRAVVYRWENTFGSADGTKLANDGRYQINDSTANITNFVERFYGSILGRHSDPLGLNHWVDYLNVGTKAGSDVARGFIFSQEYANQAATDDQFVDALYQAFFDRAPDAQGRANWLSALASGQSRSSVLDGFLYSREFSNLCSVYAIKSVG